MRRAVDLRADIEASMREQSYTEASTAPEATLRFLAAPTDVNWGGKMHGGTVMRWIDEAAYVCAAGWTGGHLRGGLLRRRAVLPADPDRSPGPGDGPAAAHRAEPMHICVHVSSADPADPQYQLTTHSLTVFVALDDEWKARSVPRWKPVSEEDRALYAHALHLVDVRARATEPPLE